MAGSANGSSLAIASERLAGHGGSLEEPTGVESLFRQARAWTLPAGSILDYSREASGLYYVEAGELRFFMVSSEGTEKTFCLLQPGSIFGETNLADPAPTPWFATAVTDTTIRYLDLARARRLVQTRPALAWAVIASLTRKLRMAARHIEDLSFRTVESRVACLILSRESGPERGGKLTHDDIARFVGSNRVTVTRALRRMHQLGILDYDRSMKRLTIVDRERLEAIAARQV